MSERLALVTGASRGIGRATAAALAQDGVRVVGVARNRAQLSATAAELGIEYVVSSIDTPEDCGRIVEEIHERFGPISILVNNAGIVLDEKPIWDQSIEVWLQTFQTNIHGAFFLTRLAAKDMVENGWGRIIMVSSTAGQAGEGTISAYCASKAAMIGLMRSVCHDVAPFNVTCNAVAPGWVRTEMAESSAVDEAKERDLTVDDIWKERAAVNPANRIVAPDEVGATIAFLASDKASAVNGQAVTMALGGLN